MITINVLAVIGCLIFTWGLLKANKKYFVFLGYFAFMTSWALVSCFYNELGIFNLELGRQTETTYATARLACFYTIFFLGVLFAARLLRRRPLTRVDYVISRKTLRLGHLKLTAYAAIVVVGLYIAYSFSTEGIPVLSGLTRLEFFKQANIVERYLIIYGSVAAFLLGYYRRKRRWFSINGIILLAFLLFSILIGNKFSFLATLLVSYYAPIYVAYLTRHPGLHLFTWRQTAALAAVLTAFLLLAFASYLYKVKDIRQASRILADRVLAFQGQMWWVVDHDVAAYGRYDARHWQVEMDNIISPGTAADGGVGMKYIMVKTLGAEKAGSLFERGFLYTHTYPAILIAMFPYAIAGIIQFFAGIGFLLILYYLYYAISYRHAIRAIIAMLILMPYIAMLFSGNFGTFFTLGMAVKIFLLIMLELGIYRAHPSHQVRPA
jgi:Family of unknown function (DUF6418)